MNSEAASHSGADRSDRRKSNRASKYGASCVGCRKRKQRCDARRPSCSRCLRLNEVCVFESARSLSAPQLVDLVVESFRFIRSIASLDPTSSSASEAPIQAQLFLSSHPPPPMIKRSIESPGDEPEGIEDRSAFQVEDGIEYIAAPPCPGSEMTEVDAEESEAHPEVDELLMHMSLAEDGQNEHFGVTSLVWQTPSPSVVARLQNRLSQGQLARRTKGEQGDGPDRANIDHWATEETGLEVEEDARTLKSNSSMLSAWESLAFNKIELDQGGEQARNIIHLLKTYFCWQYGQHCVVYPPVFLRDMALGGQYFNQFLLNVICGQAARYSDRHILMDCMPAGNDGTKTPAESCGANFLAKAKLLLAAEMEKPSSIPTIQGLLILGLRECSVGHLSQGWQYTGMAFRAMRDIGIHLDCNRLPIFGFGTLSVEDREIRRRLFWSAYTWDKIISLALGRTPTFNAWQNVSPGMIVDDTEDQEDWVPYFGDGEIPNGMENYPIQKAYTTTNYRQCIKLCEIIQKIIMQLYDGRPHKNRNVAFVKHMHQKLDDWFKQLPAPIQLDCSNLPNHCPPPYIFSNNVLYRASFILLYRIFLPNAVPLVSNLNTELAQTSTQTCMRMAEEIHQLFILYRNSFQLRNMTYTMLWSMYSAAMVNALHFRSDIRDVATAASARLVFSIHVLERGSLQTPGIRKSVEVIKQQLRAPMVQSIKRQLPIDLAEAAERSRGTVSPIDHVHHDRPDTLTDLGGASTQGIIEAHSSVPGMVDSKSGLFDRTLSGSTVSEDELLRHLQQLEPSYFYPTVSAAPAIPVAPMSGGGMDLLQGMLAMPSGWHSADNANWDDWNFEAWQGGDA